MYQYFQLHTFTAPVLFHQAVWKRCVLYIISPALYNSCVQCVWEPCWRPQAHSTASWMVIWVTYCWVPWQPEKQQGVWSWVTQSYKRKSCFHWGAEVWKGLQTLAGGHGYAGHWELKGEYPCSGKGRSAQDYSTVGEEEEVQRQTWRKGSSALTGC